MDEGHEGHEIPVVPFAIFESSVFVYNRGGDQPSQMPLAVGTKIGPYEITVVQNWFEELKRVVPAP